jgi:hypothetical protein
MFRIFFCLYFIREGLCCKCCLLTPCVCELYAENLNPAQHPTLIQIQRKETKALRNLMEVFSLWLLHPLLHWTTKNPLRFVQLFFRDSFHFITMVL